MTSPQIHYFCLELVKQAYGPEEHTHFSQEMYKQMTNQPQQGVSDIVRKGALQVDEGIRHPWLPWTDQLHSFPGSQTKADVGRNFYAKRQQAIKDIAAAIKAQQEGGLISGVSADALRYRGLKQLGEANHQLADIAAHYEKPVEQGIASRLRTYSPHTSTTQVGRLSPYLPKGYGGGLVAGREHHNSGLTMTKQGPIAALDSFNPQVSQVDQRALSRTQAMGRTTHRHIAKELQQVHGFTPELAQQATTKFFSEPIKPAVSSTAGRLIGEGSRDLGLVKSEISRGVNAVRQVAATPKRSLFGTLGSIAKNTLKGLT